jgi:hypothetical protein
MRRLGLPVLVLALTLTGSAAACSYSARLHATTHHPKAGARWPIRVTTTTHIRTSAYYAFLFRGRQVHTAEINPKSSAPGKTRFHFTGSFRDPTIVWPRESIGFPLTFQVVLKNRCGTKRLNYKVQVHK